MNQSSEPALAAVPGLDPEQILARLAATAERIETRSAAGGMLWHAWGDGPPLVLLHGGFGSWNHWCRNVEVLARRHRVIAADLPGLGDSPMPPEPYGADSLADIVEAGLLQVVPEGRFAMACFSFGSVLGSIAAERLGQRVRQFVLVGASGFGARENPVVGMVKLRPEMSPEERYKAARDNLAILMFADAANIDDVAMHVQLTNNRRARIRSRPISLTDRLVRALPGITARVDAIWGSADRTTLGELAKRHATVRAAHPEADIRTIEGAGHWVQYEAADVFNAVLLELLAA
jgi:2-hydroxy-6-oxonona-2,4-dienedioate hydrolase